MNKKKVDAYIPKAYEALAECGIAKNGEIAKTFRGQIASFGAAMTMGSFKAAVAFFAKDAGSDVERSKLLQAIHFVLTGEKKSPEAIAKKVLGMTDEELKQVREQYIDASIAIKLAMNLYTQK